MSNERNNKTEPLFSSGCVDAEADVLSAEETSRHMRRAVAHEQRLKAASDEPKAEPTSLLYVMIMSRFDSIESSNRETRQSVSEAVTRFDDGMSDTRQLVLSSIQVCQTERDKAIKETDQRSIRNSIKIVLISVGVLPVVGVILGIIKFLHRGP